jgi:hypothetical protein
MKKFYAFLAKYAPDHGQDDGSVVYGYGQAQTIVQVLKQAGDNLTRANIMKEAANLKEFAPDTLLPGVTITTSATDFYPIEQLQMQRFKGEKWELFGHDFGRCRRLGLRAENVRPATQALRRERPLSRCAAAKGPQNKKIALHAREGTFEMSAIDRAIAVVDSAAAMLRRRLHSIVTRPEEIRHRRQRHRNQAWQHHAL